MGCLTEKSDRKVITKTHSNKKTKSTFLNKSQDQETILYYQKSLKNYIKFIDGVLLSI